MCIQKHICYLIKGVGLHSRNIEPWKGKGKGKKDGMSSEKKAAQHGAMVESTGEKKTFDDSDDDDA